jgi:CubicO group peptidase (beta-lactamase class C family)
MLFNQKEKGTMIMKRVLPAVLGVMVMAVTAYAGDPALKKRLDPIIDQAVKEQRVVGAVVLVARDGKIVYKKAAGLADREAKRPVTLNTQFRLGSLSKPITTAAVLKLSDAKALRLDDPITKWLPDFQPKLPNGTTPDINVFNLITSTSGLGYTYLEAENGPYHQAGVSDGFDRQVASLDENLKRISQAPLLFEPNVDWSNSVSFDVLGAVLKKVGKGALPQVVTRTVTGPLKLKNTGFYPKNRNNVATPYVKAGPKPHRIAKNEALPLGKSALTLDPERIFDKKIYPSAGSGLVATAGDYVKFLETIRTGKPDLLERETFLSFTTNSLGGKTPDQLEKGWGFGYGVEVLRDPEFVKDKPAVPSIFTKGTWKLSGEYGSHFWVDPDEGLTVVVLTNTAMAADQGRFPDEIARAVYGPDHKIAAPAPAPASAAPATSK